MALPAFFMCEEKLMLQKINSSRTLICLPYVSLASIHIAPIIKMRSLICARHSFSSSFVCSYSFASMDR